MRNYDKELKKLGVTCLHVGGRLERKMPVEGAVFEIEDSICMCYISLENPTRQEIDAVQNRAVDARLTSVDGILFVCLNIGGVLSFDMPFNMCLYDSFRLEEPAGHGYVMPIVFADQRTNVIKALRVIGFDESFSRKLYELCRKQWNEGVADYDIRLQAVNVRYTTRQLMEKCCARFMTDGNRLCSCVREDNKESGL